MMTQKQVSHNLYTYYLSRLDWLALLIVAIIDIWIQHGLDLAQILLLQGIFGLFVMLLEFPSGVLADLTKRVNLLALAYLAMILGVATYFVADSFLWFVVAEIFFAIGLAGKSGADIAHIYDTYLERDQQHRADEVLASGKTIVYAGVMLMTALGGILAYIHWFLPFIIAGLGYSLTLVMYSLAYEPDRIKVENSSTAVKEALGYLINPKIIKLGLLLFFVNVYLRISFWDYLPRMNLLGVNSVWYGFLLAGANAIALSMSLLIRKRKKLVNYELMFLTCGVIGLILFTHQSSLVIVLISIVFHQIYRGGANVIYEIKLNRSISSETRASVSSLISAIIQGSYFVLILAFNLMNLKSQGINRLNMIMGLITATIIGCLSLLDSTSQQILRSEENSTIAD